MREPGDPAPPGSTLPNGDGVASRPVSMENGLGPAPESPEKQPGSPSPPSVPETGRGVTKGEGGAPAPASLPGGSKEEEEKAKRLLYCALCKVAVNSLSQLEAHNKGTKHKTILEARSGLGPIKAYPRLGPPTPGEPEAPAQDRTFHCEICNVKVNSEVQLKQHISSRRHRDGVAGKPNPLLSRQEAQGRWGAGGHADFLQGAAQISGRRPAPQPPGGGCGDGSGCRLPAVPAPSSCRASSSGTADHPPSTPPRSRTHPNCARSHPLLPVLTSTLTPPIQPLPQAGTQASGSQRAPPPGAP